MATQGPNSPATVTNEDNSGNPAWSNPSNAVSDNASRASVVLGDGQYSDYLTAVNFGFSIPTGATIDSIWPEVDIQTVEGGSGGIYARLFKTAIGTDPTTAYGSDYDTIQGNDNYRAPWYGPTYLFDTTWTPAEINASTFGVAIYCTQQLYNAVNLTFLVDHIRITVDYTPAATFTPFRRSQQYQPLLAQ
jgi:hypothetical protein